MNNEKRRSGFEDLPQKEICSDPEHNPPMHLWVPHGQQFRHVCPGCGQEKVLRGSGIRF